MDSGGSPLAWPRRVGRLGMLLGALVVTSGIATCIDMDQARGARAATDVESAAMIAAVSAHSELEGSLLEPVGARVSTADQRWAVADIGGETSEGYVLQGTRYVFRRADVAQPEWRVVTLGSSLGDCRRLRRLGIPVRVIDDLRVSQEVGYRCAKPPPTAVACLRMSSRTWPSVPRRMPRGCDISLSGDDNPSSNALLRLRNLRWSRISATGATATGVALTNHWPFTRYRVRARFTGWVNAWCGPQFTRVRVTSRHGKSAGRLSYGTCPKTR